MILQAKGITKNYGDHTAVKDINLEFKKGSFNAILGPNGAGKSTTISMLIGLKEQLMVKSSMRPILGLELFFKQVYWMKS